MKNNNFEKKYYSFEEIWDIPKILKIFNLIPDINTSSSDAIYLEYINLWEENEKYSGFFYRENFDVSEINNICFVDINSLKNKIITNFNGKELEFSDFSKLWEFFDNKKQSIIFYCKNFENISTKINSFFKNSHFINNNKKFILDNQWKYLVYKNKINSYMLNRTKLEDEIEHKWKMFFLPIEDQKKNKKNKEYVENQKLYKISLNILFKFIILIFSKNNDNYETFVNDLNNKIEYNNSLKFKKEINKKIQSLFSNRSQNKCIKTIIWLALLEQNKDNLLLKEWARKNDIKIKNKTVFEWIDYASNKESPELIEILLNKKREIIDFLANNNFSRKNIILLPNFIADFKSISIKENSYAIFNNLLLITNFDDDWVFDKKYLWKALGIYFINEIRNDRDLDYFNIEKIRIINPINMKWIDVDIFELNKFYNKNFNIDLFEIKNKFRKVLNGE